jgi:hypothetical protein
LVMGIFSMITPEYFCFPDVILTTGRISTRLA